MCTKLIGKTNVRYAYKVVEVHNLSGEACSPFNTYIWKIGMNVAENAGFYNYEKGQKICDGFFHLCANMSQAKSLVNDIRANVGCTLKIIKLRLLGDTYKGIHTGSSDNTDGKIAYLSNVVFWDGSYI